MTTPAIAVMIPTQSGPPLVVVRPTTTIAIPITPTPAPASESPTFRSRLVVIRGLPPSSTHRHSDRLATPPAGARVLSGQGLPCWASVPESIEWLLERPTASPAVRQSKQPTPPEAARRATAPRQHEAKPVTPITLAGLGKSSHLNAAIGEIAKLLRGRR